MKKKMSSICFKLDDSVKKEMQVICEDIGISMAGAFTMFAKRLVAEKKMPFEVRSSFLDRYDTDEIIEAREKAILNGTAILVEHDLIENKSK